MDHKPASMSLTDFFIKKVALKSRVSESIVEAVVKHQWKSANEATKKHKEVEISGIGKFYVSQSKTKKRIEHLERIQRAYTYIVENDPNERKVNITKNKLAVITETINNLKAKLND